MILILSLIEFDLDLDLKFLWENLGLEDENWGMARNFEFVFNLHLNF